MHHCAALKPQTFICTSVHGQSKHFTLIIFRELCGSRSPQIMHLIFIKLDGWGTLLASKIVLIEAIESHHRHTHHVKISTLKHTISTLLLLTALGVEILHCQQ
jgi:hypothetical protein